MRRAFIVFLAVGLAIGAVVARSRPAVAQKRQKVHLPEGSILDRFHQHTSPLCPFVDPLIEQMPWESVDLSDVSAARVRFRVQVVRSQVIAPSYDHSSEIPLISSHSVQRLDRAHD